MCFKWSKIILTKPFYNGLLLNKPRKWFHCRELQRRLVSSNSNQRNMLYYSLVYLCWKQLALGTCLHAISVSKILIALDISYFWHYHRQMTSWHFIMVFAIRSFQSFISFFYNVFNFYLSKLYFLDNPLSSVYWWIIYLEVITPIWPKLLVLHSCFQSWQSQWQFSTTLESNSVEWQHRKWRQHVVV